jgi:hypothetical protein
VGVSVYVIPLKTYLTGSFKTTWERRSESMGAPGFRITPEGVDSPEQLRMSEHEADAALRSFRRTLEEYGLSPDWTEDGPVLNASTLSYSAYARPGSRARSWSTRAPFEFLTEMEPPVIWVPESFHSPVRVPAPWDREHQVMLLSAQGIQRELDRVLEFLAADPLMEQIEAVAEGGILTGPLAEFSDEYSTAQHLKEIAGLSLEHRTPVIVEG